MRTPMLCCVVLTLSYLGCRQQTAPDEFRPAVPPENTDAASTAEAASDGADGVVELDAITLTAPADWQRKPPNSPILIAEFALPRAEGDDADGRLTISTAGGSVEANIDRWKGQFSPQPESASQEEVDVAGMKVTIVDLSGNFNDQRGPFAPGELRPGYRMIAAVIPVDGQLHFVKATGPQKTMASHADAIGVFIRSARPTK